MYLIKLQIEMNMADLIIKIVKASAPAPDHALHRYAASAHATAAAAADKSCSRTTTTHDEGGWALARLPTHFDVGDVVDVRRGSGGCGMVELGGGGRPALMRNMSEMTALEVGAGYLDPGARDRRASSVVTVAATGEKAPGLTDGLG